MSNIKNSPVVCCFFEFNIYATARSRNREGNLEARTQQRQPAGQDTPTRGESAQLVVTQIRYLCYLGPVEIFAQWDSPSLCHVQFGFGEGIIKLYILEHADRKQLVEYIY